MEIYPNHPLSFTAVRKEGQIYLEVLFQIYLEVLFQWTIFSQVGLFFRCYPLCTMGKHFEVLYAT
jgi:hypothetical protein